MINTETLRQTLQSAYQSKFNSITDTVVLSLYADMGDALQNTRYEDSLHIYEDTLQIVESPAHLEVALNKDTFIYAESPIQEGTYTIIYDADASAWKKNGITYNTTTHGFTITGTPQDDDEIKFSYFAGVDRNLYFVNGIFSTDAMSLSAVKRPIIGIIGGHINLLCPEKLLDQVQPCVDAVAEQLNASTTLVADENGKEYTVTWSCQTCTPNGKITVPLGTGEFMALKQDINFVVIESGLSACDTTLIIDGYEVPKLTFTETKVSTTTQAPMATEKRSTAVSDTETYGIDFSMPYMKDELTDIFVKAMNKTSENVVHSVAVIKDGKCDCYQMIIGKVAETVQAPQNVGLNVSLLEALTLDGVAKYDGRWKSFTHSRYFITGDDILVGVGIYVQYMANPFPIYVFFGDGEGAYFDGTSLEAISQFCHFYEGNGTRTIRVMRCDDWRDITTTGNLYAGVVLRNKERLVNNSTTAQSSAFTLTTSNSIVLLSNNTSTNKLNLHVSTTDGLSEILVQKKYPLEAKSLIYVLPLNCTVGGYGITNPKFGYYLSEYFGSTALW